MTVVAVGFEKVDGKNYSQGQLYVYPPSAERQPIPEVSLSKGIDTELAEAYRSMLRVWNTREWNATAVLCRRVVEGITKSLLPEEERKRSLAEQIRLLANHVPLDRPIISLADALRHGGNIGAHFDLAKTSDETMATLMVDLLEDMIKYLFLLPEQIEELENQLELSARQEERYT